MKELKETIEFMTSADYKERFKAEYEQVKIRFEKLKAMLDKWDNGTLEFTPTCNRCIYNFQIKAMGEYIACLETRAILENIVL